MMGPKQVLKQIMHEQELNTMWRAKLTGTYMLYNIKNYRHHSYPEDMVPTSIPDKLLATSASSSFNILGE